MRCQFCGKLTVVHIAGKGDEFVHRCPHCRGCHKFTKSGHHGSGAINYRVTKVEASPGKGRGAGVQVVRSSTGGSQ
jgi:phage FluMu protein Com